MRIMQPPVRYHSVLAQVLTLDGPDLYRTAIISTCNYFFCAKEFPGGMAVRRFLLEYRGPTFKVQDDDEAPKSPDPRKQALNWLAGRGRTIHKKIEPRLVEITIDLRHELVYASNPNE